MNVCASITWRRNPQGQLVPIAIRYHERIEITRQHFVKASPGASRVDRHVTLPLIRSLAHVEPPPPLAPPAKPKPARAKVNSTRAERIERIAEAHRRMKRTGLIEDRGPVPGLRL